MDGFAGRATRFCLVVEDAARSSQRVLMSRLAVTLADLYAEALRLPDVADADDVPAERMTAEEWEGLYRTLSASFGRHDRYRVVYQPYRDDEAVEGSLADDVADVYGDVESGLRMSKSGAPPDAVIAQWRDSFYLHWGRHALNAMAALHWALLEAEDG